MNTAKTFEDAFQAGDITSPEMLSAISDWFSLYFEDVPDKTQDPSQRVPYIVVDGLDKAAFGEYTYSVDEATPNGNAAKAALKNLEKIRARAFQQTLIGGEGFIKPIIKRGNFAFSYINRLSYIVLGRDDEGDITSIGTSHVTPKSTPKGTMYYTLLERRTVDANGYLTVESKLFESNERNVPGRFVELNTLPEYESLQPSFTYPVPFDGLGLVPIKTPMSNCVDGSHDGVSVYAAAAQKIRTQYGHERRTEDEYELTDPHLVASIDLQRRDARGKMVDIPKYITPILDESSDEAGLTIWNPKPNQEELEARANQNMRDIENIIGLRRGVLSHVETDDRTATAVQTSSGRYALTIDHFQKMWADVVPEVIRVCGLLAAAYKLKGWNGSELPDVALDFGNGVLYDEETEFNRLNLLTAQGRLRDEYVLGWLFSMPTDSEEDLAAIREKYMPTDTEPDDDRV